MVSSRRVVLQLLLVLLMLVPSGYLFWEARSGSHLGHLEDDGLYWTAAKSLAQGSGYRIVSLPGQPYQTKYPPLYPLLLAGIWRVNPQFPENLAWAVGLNWLAWMAFLACSAVLFRSLLDRPGYRWIAWAALATHAFLIYYAVQVMAEPLFAALTLGAILVAERSSKADRGWTLSAAAGVIGGLAFLAKTAGLPLLCTMPVVFAARRQYRRAMVSAAAGLPFAAGWMIWSSTHRLATADPVLLYYTDYFGFYRATFHWKDAGLLLGANLIGAFKTLTSFSAGLRNPVVPVFLLLGCMSLMGTVRLLKAARQLQLAVFALAYTAQFLFWNFQMDERFLFPLAPLCIAAGVHEAGYLWGKILKVASRGQRNLVGAAALAASLLCFSSGIMWQSPAGYRLITGELALEGRPLQAKRAAYGWLSRYASPRDVIVAYDDPSLYLYTGRPALRHQARPDAYLEGDRAGMFEPITGIAEFARRQGAAYLFLGPDDYAVNTLLRDAALRDDLFQQNRGLRLAYAAEGIRIYSVLSEPGVVPELNLRVAGR